MTEKELQYHNNISWIAKNLFFLWGWQWGVTLPTDAEPQDYEIVGCRRVLEDKDYWPLRDSFLSNRVKLDVLNKRKELGLLTDLDRLKNKDILYAEEGTD